MEAEAEAEADWHKRQHFRADAAFYARGGGRSRG
jgi:hypothetical protein